MVNGGSGFIVWEGYIVCCVGGVYCVGGVHCLRGVHCVGELCATHWQNSIVNFNLEICVLVIADQKQVLGQLTLTLKIKFVLL